jgi:predicted ATPase
LFAVLYSVWAANYVTANGNALCGLAAQFLALAEKQSATAPLLIGHRMMGISCACTGNIAKARAHFDYAMALYDPVAHRPLATRFSVDSAVSILSYRSWTLWFLGYPEAALADIKHALNYAREISQAASLMYALFHTSLPHIWCGNYAIAKANLDELLILADEKRALHWTAEGTRAQGYISALAGKTTDAVDLTTSGLATIRAIGERTFESLYWSKLAEAYAQLSNSDDAWRCIGEAITTIEATRETWFEAEVHRIAGEIALKSPGRDAAKVQAYFERALAVAREQQAKSWELRAAMSMARLWRDQGKRDEARELLAPVYGWFTEGFDTLDLKEAKALLHELA